MVVPVYDDNPFVQPVKPVVTSTQATLWHVLRLAGVDPPIAGYGRLLREH